MYYGKTQNHEACLTHHEELYTPAQINDIALGLQIAANGSFILINKT